MSRISALAACLTLGCFPAAAFSQAPPVLSSGRNGPHWSRPTQPEEATGKPLVAGHEPGTVGPGREASGGNPTPAAPAGGPSESVLAAQRALAAKGYDVLVDGVAGPLTSRAVRSFQAGAGLQENGTLDAQTLRALGVRNPPSDRRKAGADSSGF